MRRRGAAEAAPLHIVAGNPLYAAPFRGTIAAKPPETGAIRVVLKKQPQKPAGNNSEDGFRH